MAEETLSREECWKRAEAARAAVNYEEALKYMQKVVELSIESGEGLTTAEKKLVKVSYKKVTAALIVERQQLPDDDVGERALQLDKELAGVCGTMVKTLGRHSPPPHQYEPAPAPTITWVVNSKLQRAKEIQKLIRSIPIKYRLIPKKFKIFVVAACNTLQFKGRDELEDSMKSSLLTLEDNLVNLAFRYRKLLLAEEKVKKKISRLILRRPMKSRFAVKGIGTECCVSRAETVWRRMGMMVNFIINFLEQLMGHGAIGLIGSSKQLTISSLPELDFIVRMSANFFKGSILFDSTLSMEEAGHLAAAALKSGLPMKKMIFT